MASSSNPPSCLSESDEEIQYDNNSNEELSENDSDLEFFAQGADFFNIVQNYHNRYLLKQPVHTRPESGWTLLLSMLNGADIRAYQDLRMIPPVFLDFCGLLVNEFELKKRCYITVEEEVAIFLKYVGTRTLNRNLQEYFQRGGDTIHKAFHNVLKACGRMAKTWVQPRGNRLQVHPYIRNSARYFPYFKDCIGAIDDTHVKACVPRAGQINELFMFGSCSVRLKAFVFVQLCK